MDIAKYIGLYLLKNNFCYLHGLGTLKIHKKPAVQTGETLSAPSYEVSLQLGGSIDDSLPNFIATAEQTSISKASNEIRTFVDHTRAELNAGNQVPIPGIGYFVMQNGKLQFVADPSFAYAPAAIPSLTMSKRLEEVPSFTRTTTLEQDVAESEGRTGNTNRTLFIVLVAAVVIGLVALVIYFMGNSSSASKETPVEETPKATTAQPNAAPDTARASTPVAAPATASGKQIVLNTYNSRTSADKRQHKLSMTPLGEAVSVVMQDSTHYLVVMPFPGALSDSTHVLDSLSAIYGNKAVLR